MNISISRDCVWRKTGSNTMGSFTSKLSVAEWAPLWVLFSRTSSCRVSKQQGNFPRIWHRFVDDVYAIMRKHCLRQFLSRLNNSKFPTISFTHEEEEYNELNFLDVKVCRVNGKLEFDIYQKPTNTSRYITSDSFHSFEHKTSSFRSMIHRALNVPMTEEKLTNELQRIREIANINGYTSQLIDELLKAHKRKKDLRDCTTLSTINENAKVEEHWAKFNFYPELTNKMKPILRRNNIKVAHCSELPEQHLKWFVTKK